MWKIGFRQLESDKIEVKQCPNSKVKGSGLTWKQRSRDKDADET